MSKTFHKYYGLRKFLHSGVSADMGKAKPPPSKRDDPTTSNSTGAVKINFAPNEFDKRVLVWSGKYKSKSEVPDRISYDTIDHARSKVRIKMANILMVGTVAFCAYYIYRGKKSLREGDTIRKRTLDRDQKMLEEHRKKKAEKKTKEKHETKEKHDAKEKHDKHETKEKHDKHEMKEKHDKHEMKEKHDKHEMKEKHEKHEMKEKHDAKEKHD